MVLTMKGSGLRDAWSYDWRIPLEGAKLVLTYDTDVHLHRDLLCR